MNRTPVWERPIWSPLTRGKCRYGPRHESVTWTVNGWWGETSGSLECYAAPPKTCRGCDGIGLVEVEVKTDEGVVKRREPCEPCRGSGLVPRPHWPYRHPAPPGTDEEY